MNHPSSTIPSVTRRRPSVVPSVTRHLLTVILLSACASLGKSVFATPTVELKDLKVRSIGLQGGSVDVIVTVDNLNDYRLDATHLTYNLYVDTNKVFFGEIKRTVTLEPNKKTEVVIPVAFSIQDLMRATQLLGKTGGVDYRVEGEVTAVTPAHTFVRAYKGNGHFDDIGSLRPR